MSSIRCSKRPNKLTRSQQSSCQINIGNAVPQAAAIDNDRFGWTTIGNIQIPFIYRECEQYCAVRTIDREFLTKSTAYLHSLTSVPCYKITATECQLLNKIDEKHCVTQCDRYLFTETDLVVRVSDAIAFNDFRNVCYDKLQNGHNASSKQCGFILINRTASVPYILVGDTKYVPLLYFKDESGDLMSKTISLTGWNLAFMKFCCKVHGLGDQVVNTELVMAVSLDSLKNCCSSETEYDENYWPSELGDPEWVASSENGHWARLSLDEPALEISDSIEKQTLPEEPIVKQKKPMFKCDICKKLLACKYNIIVHMHTHKNERPFECNECGKSFKTKSGLTGHEQIHKGNRKYRCDQCNSSFLFLTKLQRHQRLHTGEKMLQCKCNQCGKIFTRVSGLRLHINQMHLHARPFQCDVCKQTFKQKHHLFTHMTLHSRDNGSNGM